MFHVIVLVATIASWVGISKDPCFGQVSACHSREKPEAAGAADSILLLEVREKIDSATTRMFSMFRECHDHIMASKRDIWSNSFGREEARLIATTTFINVIMLMFFCACIFGTYPCLNESFAMIYQLSSLSISFRKHFL